MRVSVQNCVFQKLEMFPELPRRLDPPRNQARAAPRAPNMQSTIANTYFQPEHAVFKFENVFAFVKMRFPY